MFRSRVYIGQIFDINLNNIPVKAALGHGRKSTVITNASVGNVRQDKVPSATPFMAQLDIPSLPFNIAVQLVPTIEPMRGIDVYLGADFLLAAGLHVHEDGNSFYFQPMMTHQPLLAMTLHAAVNVTIPSIENAVVRVQEHLDLYRGHYAEVGTSIAIYNKHRSVVKYSKTLVPRHAKTLFVRIHNYNDAPIQVSMGMDIAYFSSKIPVYL